MGKMAVASSSASNPSCSPSKDVKVIKRTKSPGVRVVGGRIYDSENGKTCHQCRQKTRDFMADCKSQKRDKQCTIKFCHKCLLNRYGEKAEDVALLVDWKCPKCRDICNCSCCMKKKGQKPTGQLFYTAKATGFSSVSEMLQIKGHDNLNHEKKIAEDMVVSPKKSGTPKKGSVPASLPNPGKENSFDGKCDSNLNSLNKTVLMNEKKSKKMKREGLKEISNSNGDVSSKKRSSKKPKISEEIASKETSKVCQENSEKKKLKVSKEISKIKKPEFSEKISKKEIGILETDSGKKKTSKTPKISEEIAKKEKIRVSEKISKIRKPKNSGILKKEVDKNDSEGGGFVKKKDCKTSVLKNDSLNLIPEEGNCNSNHENVRVPGGVENGNAGPKVKTVFDSRNIKKSATELQNQKFAADIQLPKGASLTTVAGIELDSEDVGHALQFLEFCAAFGKVLGLKKGQAECIVKELICGRSRRHGQYFPIVQIHIKLLSLILKDMGEESPSLSSTSRKNSWLQALRKCVSESKCVLNDIPSDCFGDGDDGYDKLDNLKKLKLLNFLCDEALGTRSLRSWIDDQNSKYVEKAKATRENVVAAKDKEKRLKQKLQDEVAKAVIAKHGAPLSISEHEAIVSEIKSEAAQAHSEMLEAMGMVPQKRQRSDAVRTEPILLEDGSCATRAFWKLKGYSGEQHILLQDLKGALDAVSLNEKWFTYDVDQKPEIEKYISSLSAKRLRIQKVTDVVD
ncbi:uncharacterized protein LOC116113852 isoform X1 [Pistacia vera]|uniref:uncharacterized protein LOC116113852 isoform X1 n=2 Tax=Pistacia vera TaxID=55513 RepID=UPI001263AB3B|nr:uncharacterized protein LOC116113852 isoform X1 [Pistacia vera]